MTNATTAGLVLLLSAVLVTQVSCQQSVKKEGSCPLIASGENVCGLTCYGDMECSRDQKCCRTACGGTTCVAPINTASNGRTKPGLCPKPGGPWVCSSRCGSDGECGGRSKCCKNRCGALACQLPQH